MQNSILLKPNALIRAYPLMQPEAAFIDDARQTIQHILQGHDKRLLVIVGPCSIHDEAAALEYADHLQKAAMRFSDELYVVMRVYFEKPRTILGWKGLIRDPHLDGSFDIHHGLALARKLLLQLSRLKLPAATEFLDTITPQYLSDLVSWSAVGARTSESQIHRELVSGLLMPVGFKNTTDGNVKIAVDAVNAARHAHHFLGVSKEGQAAIMSTTGNRNCHIILRGSHAGPNYTASHVQSAMTLLQNAKLIPRLMIDCSHGNSGKNYEVQRVVLQDIVYQLQNGGEGIMGVMLESNLVAGKQLLQQRESLVYGLSITDACLSWKDTLPLLERLAKASN